MALADIIEIMESFSVPNDVILKTIRTAPEDMYIYDGSELDALGLTSPQPTPTGADISRPPNAQDGSKNLSDLADGNYSGESQHGGTISLRVNGELGSVSVLSPGCTGGFEGFVRKL